jgi:hypothetical protein
MKKQQQRAPSSAAPRAVNMSQHAETTSSTSGGLSRSNSGGVGVGVIDISDDSSEGAQSAEEASGHQVAPSSPPLPSSSCKPAAVQQQSLRSSGLLQFIGQRPRWSDMKQKYQQVFQPKVPTGNLRGARGASQVSGEEETHEAGEGGGTGSSAVDLVTDCDVIS